MRKRYVEYALRLIFSLFAVAAGIAAAGVLFGCVPTAYAQAAGGPQGFAAVSVQVNSAGRVAIVTLYSQPCQAPSALRHGATGMSDGFVVFDPVGTVEAGAPPMPDSNAVRLCWVQTSPDAIAIVMYRVVDGVESATDPIYVPTSQFQVIPLDTL